MLFTENLLRMLEWHGWSADELAQKSFLSPEKVKELIDGREPVASELVTLCRTLGPSIDRMLTRTVQPVAKRSVKLLVLDVDGVMTDGGMYVLDSGDEMKKYHTRDGRGIKELQKAGTEVAFLSGSFNGEGIYKRAERLGIERVFAGRQPKTGVLGRWMAEMAIEYKDVAFVGDDLNDLEVLGLVGLAACPANAVDEVKATVDIVLKKGGGEGCVREFIDTYLL